MFKAIVKRPSAALCRKLKAPRLALSFSTTRPTLQFPATGRQFTSLTRSSSKSVVKFRAYATVENDEKTPQETADGSEIPHDAWVSILENTVSAPWLAIRPPVPEQLLERAFTLVLQILLSLNMPRDPEAAQAFFFAFENAPVSLESDIGRGRRAIAILARTVIDDIASIPETSSLRKEHPKIFSLNGALIPLADLHLREPSGDVEDWKAFWTRAESPLFELNSELHTSGFGMDLDELLKAKKEEDGGGKKP